REVARSEKDGSRKAGEGNGGSAREKHDVEMGSGEVQGRLPRCAHGSDRGKGRIRWEGDRRKAEGEAAFDEGNRSGGCASGESESAERRKEEARAAKNEASQKSCVMS